MRDITLEELLEAGCHFGHQINRRNPRADEFIFEERDKVHIINLEATREGLIKAANFVKDLSEKGGSIVVVGTKRQARQIVKDAVTRAKEEGAPNIHSITYRWVGGMLTNFDEVKKNYKKLQDLGEFLKSGKSSGYTKREMVQFEKQRAKLEEIYGGVKTLNKTPDALFVIDTHLETTAISEAKSIDVALVGIVDTNADPAEVEFAIPANDDAVGSIKIITDYIVDAWIEGAKKLKAENLKLETDKEKAENKQVGKTKKEEQAVEVEKKEDEKPEEAKKVAKKVASKSKVGETKEEVKVKKTTKKETS